MNSQSIIVPKISTLPVHEPRARAILRWLVRKNIVKEELSTCGRTGNRMAYAIADGARAVVLHPRHCLLASRSMVWRSSSNVASTRRPRAFSRRPVAPNAAAKSAKRCSKASKTGFQAAPTTSPAGMRA